MQTPNNEFSYPVDLAAAVEHRTSISVEASENQRQALARRFGIVAVRALSVDARVARRPDFGFSVSGTLSAEAVQRCGVTGRPVTQQIEENFDIAAMNPAESRAALELDESLDIETIDGNEVDLGELAAQYLALALDPYPRHPEAGEVLDSLQGAADSGAEDRQSPFAILSTLKDKTRN